VIVRERIAQLCGFPAVSHDNAKQEIEPLSNMTKMLFAAALVLGSASIVLATSSPSFAKHSRHGYAGHHHARHHHGLMSRSVSLRTGRSMMNRASQVPGGGDK
jgi:hypothetical protein